MDDPISILKLTGALARHAAQSHAVTAQNIARADIPGSTASQIEEFERGLARLDGAGDVRSISTTKAINIEEQMLSVAEAGGRHQAAVSIWRSAINMMRLAVTGPQ